MKSYAFIVAYYGVLPTYFSYWLKCAQNNPLLDFFIITDNDISVDVSNIHIIRWSFRELKRRLQCIFPYRIILESPYKLCDYKPVYGLLLHDFLLDFDYWGYIDVDLIFGDVTKFLRKIEGNSNYERIGLHGHMTLMKNTEEFTTYFWNPNNLKEVYRSKEVYTSRHIFGYDEVGGGRFRYGLAYQQIKEDKNIFPLDDYVSDIEIVHKNFNCSRRGTRICDERFEYIDGSLYSIYMGENAIPVREEIMYAHFQKRNMVVDAHRRENYSIIPNMICANTGIESSSFIPSESEDLRYKRAIKRNILKKRITSGSIYWYIKDSLYKGCIEKPDIKDIIDRCKQKSEYINVDV